MGQGHIVDNRNLVVSLQTSKKGPGRNSLHAKIRGKPKLPRSGIEYCVQSEHFLNEGASVLIELFLIQANTPVLSLLSLKLRLAQAFPLRNDTFSFKEVVLPSAFPQFTLPSSIPCLLD